MNAAGSTAGVRGIAWHWSFFLLGVVYALPAVVVTPFLPIAGVALAVGVLPVAAFNLPGPRAARRTIPVVGLLSGASFVVGSLLTQLPALAVAAMFGLSVGCAVWAHRARAGMMALSLVLPLVGIALSYVEVVLAAAIGALVFLGSLYAWGVAMLWPEHQVPPPVPSTASTTAEAVIFGLLLGTAAACAAAIGYALGLEHVGWATGSVLLVMRPVRAQLVLRSLGRAASVLCGALAAASFAMLTPVSIATALVVGLVLAALSATQSSRWYIAPGFTTFLVLTLILQIPGERPAQRFTERVLETLFGVGLALLFGALIPAVLRAVSASAKRKVPR